MKKILIYMLCALFLASMTGIADAATATAQVKATVGVSTAASISLSSALVDFGSITGSLTTYRYRKPLATDTTGTPAVYPERVTWVSIPQYEIRVWTNNGVGVTSAADARGFIRDGTSATANRLPLKVWCANYSANKAIQTVNANGPTLGSIGVKTDYLWKGYDLNGIGGIEGTALTSGSFNEATLNQDLDGDGTVNAATTITASATNKVGEGASFSYVREKDGMIEGTTLAQSYTRCILSWNQSGLNAARGTAEGADLEPTFPVAFGVDLSGVNAGTYDSNNNAPNKVDPSGSTPQAGATFELLTY